MTEEQEMETENTPQAIDDAAAATAATEAAATEAAATEATAVGDKRKHESIDNDDNDGTVAATAPTDGQQVAEVTEVNAGDETELPPATKRVRCDPIHLGPKVFHDADSVFRFFSGLLAEQTIDQDINEVRASCHSKASILVTHSPTL